jgi:integration host factor subunit beta
MLKSQLVEKIARANPKLFQRDAEKLLQILLDEITTALASHGRVELRGFGSFRAKHRDAHLGRNPRTGVSILVQDKYLPSFKMAREIHERLNPEGSGLGSMSGTKT